VRTTRTTRRLRWLIFRRNDDATAARLAVGGFAEAIAPLPLPPLVLGRLLLDRAIFASRRRVPLKKRNFVGVLSNSRGPAGSTLAAIHYLRFFSEGVPIPKGSLRVGTIVNCQFSIINASSPFRPETPAVVDAEEVFHSILPGIIVIHSDCQRAYFSRA